jgi:ketosteroid isomerase-like protein
MGVTHSNEQLLRDTLNALTSGDMEALRSFATDDFVGHVPGSNQLSGGYKSRDEFINGFFGKIGTLTGDSSHSK